MQHHFSVLCKTVQCRRASWRNLIGIGLVSVAALTLAGCGGDDDHIYVPPFQPYDVPNSVVIADFDNDGKNDIAVAYTHVDNTYPDAGYAGIILQSHTSAGTFQQSVDTAIGTNPSIIALGDLDEANGIDLVTANASSNNVSVLLQGTTAGQFNTAMNVAANGSANGVPNDVAAGDLNNDGLADIAVADSYNGNVDVLLQDPANHGHFLTPAYLATGNQTISVAVGDVNGDGLADVVATSYDLYGNNGVVSVFIQDANNPGSFLTRVDYASGPEPSCVKIADVNGDGKPDLVITNRGPGADHMGSAGVSVLLQVASAPGTFTTPVTYATAPGAINVAVGDLNGDGKPDLVVANLGGGWTGSVSVLLQDPAQAGVFQSATNYAGVYGPLSVAIGDLNGDGKPDIAVADGNRATVMFQSATTAGSFADPVLVGD
ncbi:MAG: VCBS repeat-containing protein [Steroidobacter sp.]